MSLVDRLLQWPHMDLAKALAQHAKENAELRNEAGRLRHDIFWMNAKENSRVEEAELRAKNWEGAAQLAAENSLEAGRLLRVFQAREKTGQKMIKDRDERIAELEIEALAWMKCARNNQEMLNTIGRQLGGQIPEQLVSEVARERMAEIADLIHPFDLAAYRRKKSLHK